VLFFVAEFSLCSRSRHVDYIISEFEINVYVRAAKALRRTERVEGENTSTASINNTYLGLRNLAGAESTKISRLKGKKPTIVRLKPMVQARSSIVETSTWVLGYLLHMI
jgi:hypothetical protein